jgi:hypothetical protein
MSNYNIIRDISEEMRRRIYTALDTTPDHDFGLPPPTEAIAFEPPGDRIRGNRTQLSLFLYHIEVDPHTRNQPDLRIAPDGLRRPPLPLNLHYLVTPLTDAEDDNHLMLGRILQHFHFRPALDSIAGVPIGDSFGGGVIESPYHLSVTFSVTPIAIDSDLGAVQGARVAEAHTVIGQKNGGQVP